MNFEKLITNSYYPTAMNEQLPWGDINLGEKITDDGKKHLLRTTIGFFLLSGGTFKELNKIVKSVPLNEDGTRNISLIIETINENTNLKTMDTNQIKEKVAETASEVAEGVKHVAGDLKEKSGEALESLKGSANDAIGKLKGFFHKETPTDSKKA